MPFYRAAICYSLSVAGISAQSASLIISSNSLSARPGEQINITYSLTGQTETAAFQWDETLDSQLTVSKRELAPSLQAAQKQLHCANQRCLVFGMNQNLIPNGPAVVTHLTVSPTASTGKVLLRLQNLIAATPDATQVNLVAGGVLELQIVEARSPSFTAGGIVNAATFQPGVVPGGLVTIFGTGISNVIGVEEAYASFTYKGSSVFVNGRAAPLITIANADGTEQINLQVPFETGTGTATVEVDNNGIRGTASGILVFDAQPGIFEVQLASTVRVGAVAHADGLLVSPENPATRGEIVSLYFTGGGRVSPSVNTGVLGPVPAATILLPVSVMAGGAACRTHFAGYAPAAIGLYQVNFEVAADAPIGSSVPVLLRIGERTSNTVRVAISEFPASLRSLASPPMTVLKDK